MSIQYTFSESSIYNDNNRLAKYNDKIKEYISNLIRTNKTDNRSKDKHFYLFLTIL